MAKGKRQGRAGAGLGQAGHLPGEVSSAHSNYKLGFFGTKRLEHNADLQRGGSSSASHMMPTTPTQAVEYVICLSTLPMSFTRRLSRFITR